MTKQERKEYVKDYLRQEMARRDFWYFCLYYDREFFQSRSFLKDIAIAFQKVEEGKIKSLSVSMPPRAGKSYITSLYCAWTLGRNPAESVMRNTCTATLYLKFAYDVRAVIKSDIYRLVFPEVKLSDDKKNLQGWNTNKSNQVGYFGAGVGGTIIGFGATKVAITDDLYRGIEDAMSDTYNDKVIQWKEATHDSRFESGCARIDIGTRWTINDMIGRNMAENIYDESIVIPAMDANGNSFCEAVMTTEEYIEKKKRTPTDIWLAEYMQEPTDIKGRLFGDLSIIDKTEFDNLLEGQKTQQNPHGYVGAIAYCDVSDEGADYTASAVGLLIGKKIYIADYVFSRDNTDITIPLVASMLDKWKVNYCRVESNSMGAMFGRHLQTLTKTRILPVANQTNKMTRIIMRSAHIINEMVFVKNNNAHSEQFMMNLYSFTKEGKNKHDDAPDCMAGLSIFAESIFKV